MSCPVCGNPRTTHSHASTALAAERREFPLEAEARAVKARWIARRLRAAGATSEYARDLSEQGWNHAAKLAGYDGVSSLTRRVVIALLKADES